MCSIDGLEIAILVGVVIIAVIGMFLAFRYGYSYRKKVAETKIGSAEDEAKRIIDSAKSKSLKDAENTKKEKLLEAKEEIHKERNELEKEIKERRNELQRQERRIQQKEDTIDKKTQILEKKEDQLQMKLNEVDDIREEVERVKKLEMTQLEKVAEMSADEAKTIILRQVEEDTRHEAGRYL